MTLRLKAYPTLDVTKEEKEGKLRDVCRQAVWSLSSCKSGHGIDQLMDESVESFWQSDGPQPHCVNIQFPRKTTLSRLCLYTDYKADESYTPSKLAIRVGTHVHELTELVELEMQEPTGWSVVPLHWPDGSPLRVFLLQLAVLANHQNGRDTHLRAIRLQSPVQTRGLETVGNPFLWPGRATQPTTCTSNLTGLGGAPAAGEDDDCMTGIAPLHYPGCIR